MFTLFFGIKLKFKGNLFAGLADGVKETLYTDSEDDTCVRTKELLDECSTWSKHISGQGLKDFSKFMRQGKYENARQVLDVALLASSDDRCIIALKLAISLIANKCPKILSESLPSYYL